MTHTTLPLPTTVLWDMDGTLIDQTAAIIRCYADVIVGLGNPEPDSEAIRRSLGGPMASTMALFIAEDTLRDAEKRFRSRFPEIMFEGLIILKGGHSLIESFHARNISQAIFTNKHGDTARKVSAHVGYDRWIQTCVGNTDTQWHKPQAELTAHVLNQMHSTASGACMIGDSPTDIKTAHNAGLVCYGVSTGAHSITELKKEGADAVFANLIELKEAFEL